WTSPTGMVEAEDTATLATPNASGVSMQVNYEERPTAGATGTRTATASANADTGATHSIALKAAPLVCFVDNFNRANGSPGSGWAVSNSGGTFGNPVIASNRLRLTDATGNVATMATLQRIFPGAGNRIEVLFDHYAYGGSGADGIVLVLSDNAITPSPGGYGGSLGYAQNTAATPSKPGFSGGWLGVGIDEFGNFSNPTEGRTGGPGARADSLSIRGSGSGNTGYTYHTGTAANLVPQIDNNGAASPAHRYRVIVDHSNGINAYVSVERNTGTGYVTLVSPYDAKAQAGQAAVPTNWILSYTGSTGGSTNIHEIDNLQICATAQSAVSAIHHFEISVVASASTCTPHNVTITAKDASNNTLPSYTGPLTITTSTNHGNWSAVTAGGTLNNGASDDGAATYNFVAGDNGVITLALSNTHADDLTINVVETGTPATSSTSSVVNFRDSAFVFTEDPIQIAGRPQAMTVSLYTRVGGSCPVDTAYTGTKNLDAWITRLAPDPNGTAPTIGALSLPSAAPAVVPGTNNLSLNFVNGVATFNLNTSDVGKYALNFRDDTRLYATAVDIGGASQTITARPWLNVQVPGNPATDLPTGGILTSAGSSFTGTVRGVLWNAADDANNDGVPNVGANLNDNVVALRFAWPTALNAVTPIAPVGGATGTVGNGAVAQAGYTNGVATVNNLSYSEVGSFTLQASVANYLNTATADLIGTLTPVGRFTPHHFAVTGGVLSTRLGAGCVLPVSTFTYMNEAIGIQYNIAAQNLANATTQNYTGVWATLNLNVAASHNFGARDNTAAINLSGRLGVNSIAGNWSTGTAAVTGSVSLSRAVPDAPDGPYSDFRIGVAPSEGGVVTTAMDLDVDGNATNDRVQLGTSTQIRYGRLRLFNTQGSTDFNLPVPMRLEYWNGTSFATNTADSCTTLPRSAITMDAYLGELNACETAFALPTISFSNGEAAPALLAPGNTNNGSVALRVNLGAPPSGQYCSAIGGGTAPATSAARSYLLGRWDDSADPDANLNTGYDDGPASRAAFGLNNNVPQRIIYSRENY
ncbi:MAG TPA: DUF6701 domain-containing protein, partial [Burkholderiales bacterium]|nr:DUF6701 domain-containing protein [Burkholderiales bacterium]